MRHVSTLICLGLVILLVFGAFQFKKSQTYYSFQQTSGNFIERIKHFLRVKKHNISLEFESKDRKQPLDVVYKEAKLRMVFSEYFKDKIFEEFTQGQWREFWALIYEPIEEKQGSLKVKRFRTQEEIEDELIYNYPDSFSWLREKQWEYFWSIIYPAPRYQEPPEDE